MRGKKQNVRLWAVAFWLIVWQLAALALHAAYPHGALLLPSPVSSLARLISLAGTAVFCCPDVDTINVFRIEVSDGAAGPG